MEKIINPIECKHYDTCTKRKGIWAGTYFVCQFHKYCSDFTPKKNEWTKGTAPKVPKTWEEAVKSQEISIDYLQAVDHLDGISDSENAILKSAIALIKIHQLIEVGYGGNVTDKEWKRGNYSIVAIIEYEGDEDDEDNKGIHIRVYDQPVFSHIAFRGRNMAEEFISHPENMQLLKDYFMI